MASGRRSVIGPLVAASAALAVFYLVGVEFLDGFRLDLGSLNFPTPGYVVFVAFWTLLGGAAVVAVTVAGTRWAETGNRLDRLREQLSAGSERRFLLWVCGLAAGLPLFLRYWLLQGAPLADDESAYRFAAQLLASGRLWVASPPMKLFFDQNFIINDGRLYTVYFLGWPAILVGGVLLHAPGVINPLLSALTVPALYRVIRHFTTRVWARAGVLLYASAPLLLVGAATLLSHTSCLLALTWCLFFCLRARSESARPADHAGVAGLFALAFWIRPESAAAVGLPVLVYWMLGLRTLKSAARPRAILAFLVPAVILGGLFLWTLRVQYGSAFTTGYERSAQYLVQNDFRFTSFSAGDLTSLVGFDFGQPGAAIARTASGLFRLNFDLFGWPSSFVLLLFAGPGPYRRARLLWWMIATFLLVMLFQRDWGIDTFGPLHAFDVALPVIVLTVIGARNLSTVFRDRAASGPVALAALMVTAWIGFVPVRLEAVREIAAHVNLALTAPERAGLHRAVIFSPLPFAPDCDGTPRTFVLFRPVNDPDFQNDILWVNHLDLLSDRRLMETFPGRTGYLMRWTTSCTVTLTALSSLRPEDVMPGPIRFQ